MALTSGIISGFDQARRSYRDAELKKAQADQDREFSILQALAQHVDPEIAAMGAAGLLQLAAGGPKTGKGLKGFLGEVDRSTFLPEIQKFLGAGTTATVPQPGSAAQPNTAVVEPQRQASGPGIAAPPGPPAPGTGPGITPPQFGAPEGPAVGGVTPPAFGGDLPGGPPAMAMGPPPPPPPETPQQRSRRLFPSAADVAAETTYRNLQARLTAVLEAIRRARTPDELDVIRGIAGAPRRASASKPLNAEFRTADGQEMTGTVIFDPATQTAEVDGQPVTILRLLPTNAPRPIRVNVRGPGDTVTAQFRDPNDPSAAPIASIPTGMPVSEPPPYSGTATVDGRVVRLPRGGGDPEDLGAAPQPAGALSAEQRQATAWLTDVNAAVKAQLSTYNQNRPPGMKATALPTAQQDALVKQITRGRYQTLGQLTAATKRQQVAGPELDDSPRARANRVRQRLERQTPSIVQGPGLPPGE